VRRRGLRFWAGNAQSQLRGLAARAISRSGEAAGRLNRVKLTAGREQGRGCGCGVAGVNMGPLPVSRAMEERNREGEGRKGQSWYRPQRATKL
jgi:hypothetical protein